MIFAFKPTGKSLFPRNEFCTKEEFKTILDRLNIENVILGDKLVFSASIDQLVQLDKDIDPDGVGWYDPEEVWG